MKGLKEKDVARKALGRQGEDIAAAFLESKGMIVLERNIHCGHQELDIICADVRTSCLRFVEVKSRKEPVEGEPWEAVNAKKQANLVKGAKAYMASKAFRDRKLFLDEIIFDIITIVWDADGASYRIEYIPDAFRPVYA